MATRKPYCSDLKVDQIVHLDVSFDHSDHCGGREFKGRRWLQCKVVEKEYGGEFGKCFEAIGLKGKWKEEDLCYREEDGSLCFDYHVHRIKDKKPLRHIESAIWESETYIRPEGGLDPTELKLIKIKVPPLTKKKMTLLDKYNKLRESVFRFWEDPEKSLEEIKKVVNS